MINIEKVNPEVIRTLDPEIEILNHDIFLELGINLSSPVNKMLTYCSSIKFFCLAMESPAVSCIVTNEDVFREFMDSNKKCDKCVILSSGPRETFFLLHNYIAEHSPTIQFDTQIGVDCRISKNAIVAEKNVHIGRNVIIEDNVILCEGVSIGSGSIVRSGSIIGNEGFQFLRVTDMIIPIKHIGGVEIGSNVEIQSMCCVDKHVFNRSTTIGNYTKLDNRVHIAHMSTIGERCMLAAGVIVSGDVAIGNDCWIGPGSIISNSLVIEDNAQVSLGSVVTTNVRADTRVSGNFAINHDKFIRHMREVR